MVYEEELNFTVVKVDRHDEVIARAANLLVGRAAYETARGLYPKALLHYRHGARIIARSDEPEG